MAARKRKQGEFFLAYRFNLKTEARNLKRRLKGFMFFNPYVEKGINLTYRRNAK